MIQPTQKLTQKHYQLLLSADPSETIISRYINLGKCFDYYLDETLIGVLVILPTRPNVLEIMNIAVVPTHQGQGIGTSLILFALAYAQKYHYSTVEIGTGSTSFGQLYLYQKCGFRIAQIQSDYFTQHYKEEIIENKLVLKDRLLLRLELPSTDK